MNTTAISSVSIDPTTTTKVKAPNRQAKRLASSNRDYRASTPQVTQQRLSSTETTSNPQRVSYQSTEQRLAFRDDNSPTAAEGDPEGAEIRLTPEQREELIKELGIEVPEDATPEEIDAMIVEAAKAQYRKAMTKQLGLPEDASDEEIVQAREEKAKEAMQSIAESLGLPEDASQEEIHQALTDKFVAKLNEQDEAGRKNLLKQAELPENATDDEVRQIMQAKFEEAMPPAA